jgi:spore coat protein CotF
MVFPEFVEDHANAQQLTRVIRTWLENETVYNELKSKLKKTKQSFDFTLSDILLSLILKNNIQIISTQVQLAKLKKNEAKLGFYGGQSSN